MKVGDKVRICWTQERKVSHDFHGIGTSNGRKIDGLEGTIVELKVELNRTFPRVSFNDEAGSFSYWIPPDCVILLDSESTVIDISLKIKNSTLEATNCASCGGLLKEPYPLIKFCPKCEG